MIIATAGHVDHGKTELIKALTGVDTDRLPEEKKRGLSIDLGFAYVTLADGAILGFVDVPGHEKFIRNMLAGVAGIDLSLLVIAADDGVMQQTREHLIILNLLGIDQCLVALTKIDRVSSNQLYSIYEEIRHLFEEMGRTACSIFPICAPKGVGVDLLMNTLSTLSKTIVRKNEDGYFRMAIDRVFSLKGVGLIVTGLVFSGTIKVTDKVTLSSNGSSVRIRSIRANNSIRQETKAGERCALNIVGRGIDINSVTRGSWIMHSNLYRPTRRMDVDLSVVGSEANYLKHWAQVHLYIGSDNMSVRVALLSSGKIIGGNNGLAQLILPRNAFAIHGDRFVLRDKSTRHTIGGGRVIDPHAPKRGRTKPDRISALKAMRVNNKEKILTSLVELSEIGVGVSQFSLSHNLLPTQTDALLRDLELKRVGPKHDQQIFSKEKWRFLLDRIVENIAKFHKSETSSFGPSIKDIQFLLNPSPHVEVLKEALKVLIFNKEVLIHGYRFQLPSHHVSISKQNRFLLARSANILTADFGTPLSLNQAAEKIGVQSAALEKALKLGVKLGDYLHIDKNRYLLRTSVTKLKATAIYLASRSPDGFFTTNEYRNEVNLGRNFIISLLQYFDQIGFTTRIGENRKIRSCSANHKSLLKEK